MKVSHKFLLFLGLVAVVAFLAYGIIVWGKNAAVRQPHIVLILADDMGRNDVSFNGANEIPTPNIDALAYNGVILNRHYALPICTPSRTSLMTGRYAIREGMQGFPMKAGEARGIPLNVTLMPEYFRKLGYSTRLVGKWHLGYFAPDYTPARRGFDSFFGYYNGLITYFNHWIKQELNDTEGKIFNGSDLHRDVFESLSAVKSSEYFTDLITNEAEKIIQSHSSDKPLFLEVAHLAVHASEAADPLEVRNTTEVNEQFSYINDEKRRKYAGMLRAMDDSVGRIVTALSKANMLENSIIVFMSDNGAPTVGMYENAGSNYPLRGIKATLFEGGVRVAACIFSPLIKLNSRVSEHMMHITDWLPTLYAAAGGELGDLEGPIDGVNQWPTIAQGAKTLRYSALLNIDEIIKTEAAINGRYKLLKGAEAEGEDYYGGSGNDPSYPAYDVEVAFSSPAGVAIAQLDGFAKLNHRRAWRMRRKSTLQCKPVASHANCSTLCLFDIESDPCETRDLSLQYPKIVKTLESIIESYKTALMPQTNQIVDRCSDPQRFNGSWMPWRTNSTLMIPTTTSCQSPNLKLQS